MLIKHFLIVLFSLATLNVHCQENLYNHFTTYSDTIKSLIRQLDDLGKDEVSDENHLLDFESFIIKNFDDTIIDSKLKDIFYQKLESLNKSYFLNFSILSKYLFWSSRLKKYTEYSNKIFELVRYYYNENQDKFYLNSKDKTTISKESVYQQIIDYGYILNKKDLDHIYIQINDSIYNYDPSNYTNLIFRVNYFINTKQHNEAINVLTHEIYGYELNEYGEVINKYNPSEVDYYMAVVYNEIGNTEMAIEYLDKIISGNSDYIQIAINLKKSILKEK